MSSTNGSATVLGNNRVAELFSQILHEVNGNGSSNGNGKPVDMSVVMAGAKIVLPEGAHIPDVITTLQRQHRRNEETVTQTERFLVSPYDGAKALVAAIEATLGPATTKICNCGNPECGQRQLTVEIGLNESIKLPWGTFNLPGMEDAHAEMDTYEADGRVMFCVHIRAKRKYEDRVKQLVACAREEAKKNSILKGKIFSMRFLDDDGDQIRMPEPKFFDLGTEDPIFNDDLTQSIDRNILVTLRDAQVLMENGESVKLGVLAAGEYGVGKTLLANFVAREAAKYGWTVIYVKDPNELEEALTYARLYEPAVLLVEDGDRIAGEERTDEVNELINEVDGVDGKTAQVMVIYTTNHPEKINPAMRRPGRIDVVLNIKAPDADTAQKMLRAFAGELLDPAADLSAAGEVLAGKIPACIRQAVSRAKKEVLRRTGGKMEPITTGDLTKAATEVVTEHNSFRPAKAADGHALAGLGKGLSEAGEALTRHLQNGHATRELVGANSDN